MPRQFALEAFAFETGENIAQQRFERFGIGERFGQVFGGGAFVEPDQKRLRRFVFVSQYNAFEGRQIAAIPKVARQQVELTRYRRPQRFKRDVFGEARIVFRLGEPKLQIFAFQRVRKETFIVPNAFFEREETFSKLVVGFVVGAWNRVNPISTKRRDSFRFRVDRGGRERFHVGTGRVPTVGVAFAPFFPTLFAVGVSFGVCALFLPTFGQLSPNLRFANAETGGETLNRFQHPEPNRGVGRGRAFREERDDFEERIERFRGADDVVFQVDSGGRGGERAVHRVDRSVFEEFFERFRAVFEQKLARVGAVRERQDVHVDALFDEEAEDFSRPFLARFVAVEEQNHFVREPLQHADVFRAEGRSQDRDDVLEAELRRHDAVGVPFDDDDLASFADRVAGQVESVNHFRLRKNRRFRRVDVFRRAFERRVREEPPAERDDAVLNVANRENKATAETVVIPSAFVGAELRRRSETRARFRASVRVVIFAVSEDAGRFQRANAVAIGADPTENRAEIERRVTDLETLARRVGNAAVANVSAGRFRFGRV